MSVLLDDIINLATDGGQPLPDILRKCLRLGHELKDEQLKAWANQELNGYKSGKEVPDYRIVPAPAKGNFIGPLHAQYNRHIIPPAVLEKEHRGLAETAYLLQSVSAYADVVKSAEASKGSLIFEWPANMVVYYQEKLMQGGFICLSAWQELPVNAIVELLDTVLNRTLNMALQIKDELGTSYADLHRIEPSEAAKIQSIIVQTTGGTTNVAFRQSSVNASGQMQTNIAVGDRKALDEILTKAGLEKPDVDALTEAMQIDGDKPGNKVEGWIKAKASKVLVGAASVGSKIGAEILTAWIKQYYGL
jgi:AbiTii